LAFTELHEKATRRVAADFLLHLIKAVPYKVHTVLTDNGTHFTDPKGESWSVPDIKAMLERGEPFWPLPLKWLALATTSIIALPSPSIPGPTGKSSE
jgi:hypothetical protein